MTNVTTFEEELEQINVVKTPFRGKKKAPSLNDGHLPKEATKKAVKKEDKSVVDKLGYDANNKLNYYLKKMPQWQILEKQINILKEELDVYKKNGSAENYQKTKDMIVELTINRTELKNIFKNGNTSSEKSKAKRDELNTKIKNSVVINSLLATKKELLKELKNSTTSWWVSELKSYRTRLSMLAINKNKVVDFDDIVDETEQKMLPVEQEYIDFCGRIADIIFWDINEVMDGTVQNIKRALESRLDNTEEIKEKLDVINAKISAEKDALSDSIKLTDMLFNVFDFADESQEKEPKEILILSNINYVKSIAYNICVKFKALNKMDDAVSAGLLGLTVAVNSWYVKQSLQDSPLSFKGFSSLHIYGAIQRELLGLEANGTESGSSKATVNTHNKQKINNFLKDNPQYEGVDKSILIDLLASYDDKDADGKKINTGVKTISNVTTESEYSNVISDEEGDSSEIWANAASSDDNIEELLEGKMEYEKMLKSISDLLNLFETKTDNKTGLLSITNKKLFDKYDKKIFMMYFGLQHKIEKELDKNGNNVTRNEYTQEEIADELFYMMKADGLVVNEPFSQPAINYRITKILTKIKSAMEFNPELKMGFEYFINIKKSDGNVEENPNEKSGNWRLNNPDLLRKLSNNREEINMKIDRDELREIYSDDENALNRQLSDGKRLSDTFQISETNPLDDEIASMFADI